MWSFNAINLIDGVDGLVAATVVAMSAFGMWAYWTGDMMTAYVGAAVAGGLAGFLVFNLHPAKIFMGDSGSLLLGLMAYVMAVNVVQTPDVANLPGVVRPVAAMCLLAFPLVDTLRVFTLRVLNGQSPFTPDRRHIHHLLMQLGWGHRLTSAALWMYSLLFVVLAFQPEAAWGGIGRTAQFFVLLGLAFALGSLPYFMVRMGLGISSLSAPLDADGTEPAPQTRSPARGLMKFPLAVGVWMMGCGLIVAQTPTSTRWHLPLDSAAWNVRLASDSSGVLVPSVQPMTAWNRPLSLQPQSSTFEGIAVVGEARRIVGDFRATSTAIGLGTSGTFLQRGSYHVVASRWRIPLGFPLAREVADHGSMDGLGNAVLQDLNQPWPRSTASKAPCPGRCPLLSLYAWVRKVTIGGAGRARCFWTATWRPPSAHGCGWTPELCSMRRR